MSKIYEARTKDFVASVHYDECAESPRDWDNLGTMVCWHRRYSLGDKHQFSEPSDFHETINANNSVILSLFMLDHSGITISTSDFGCPWDSGQIGHIYITHEDIKKEYGELTEETIQKAKERLESEVRIYDLYVRGEVYGYRIERKLYSEKTNEIELEHEDSCWGFIGDMKDSGLLEDIISFDKELGELIANQMGIKLSA